MDRTDETAAAVLAGVTAAVADAERANRAVREAIIAAYHQRLGRYTVSDIAVAAGITRERIYQIVKAGD